jgi:hypothetical protein
MGGTSLTVALPRPCFVVDHGAARVDGVRAKQSDMGAQAALEAAEVGGLPLYVVGTYSRNVTVLAQQTRALNLAFALTRLSKIPRGAGPEYRVAVIGGGFAGLTFAAGLLAKSDVHITVFERRDNVLPLQQGNDSRWLHPHIYSWPQPGSQAPSAALPLLNWTASRASDVVVQVLAGWEALAKDEGHRLRVLCNTTHMRVTSSAPKMTLEYLAEEREHSVPSQTAAELGSVGTLEDFDLVVLALGFGLERDHLFSYWRNETLAQPALDGGQATYIVSGYGDGAVIDLVRLRVAQFRQDRILAELFEDEGNVEALLTCLDSHDRFQALELWWGDLGAAARHRLDKAVRARLRRDTRAVLHVRKARFAELFSDRTSAQNSVLLYLLYRCGAFTLSRGDVSLDDLAAELRVAHDRIIVRHGVEQELQRQMTGVLPAELVDALEPSRHATLAETAEWPGGYFGFKGPKASSNAGDNIKRTWRKEHLPDATEVVAATFCSAVAGRLSMGCLAEERLRVALHRVLFLERERLLQQSCAYLGLQNGIPLAGSSDDTAGRTFRAEAGTIGLAYRTARIVETRIAAPHVDLQADMKVLQLNTISRRMSSAVRSVAAVPLLGGGANSAEPVAVLYIDSTREDALDRAALAEVVAMCDGFLEEVARLAARTVGRIGNYEFWGRGREAYSPVPMDSGLRALRESPLAPPSRANVPFLNFEISDFSRVGTR